MKLNITKTALLAEIQSGIKADTLHKKHLLLERISHKKNKSCKPQKNNTSQMQGHFPE
jgi:hypothetical protein